MDRKHIISGSFWLAFSIFVAVTAFDLGLGTLSRPGSGFIFFWSAVGLGILSVIVIIKNVFQKGEAIPCTDLWKGLHWRKTFFAIAILFIYTLMLEGLGFVLSTLILMIVLFGIGISSHRVVIVSALITTIVSVIVFRHFLEVRLPRGLFGW